MNFKSIITTISILACMACSGEESIPEVIEPQLTALIHSSSMTWTAKETDTREITVEGTNLDAQGIILSELIHFSASVTENDGKIIVTVAPNKRNITGWAMKERLSVSAEGGNSLDILLTQLKQGEIILPSPSVNGKWKPVTDNRDDWSGIYLFVTSAENNYRFWNLENNMANTLFLTVDENRAVTAAGTSKGATDLALGDLYNYVVSVEKDLGGYTIMTVNGQYLSNTGATAQTTVLLDNITVGADTITMLENGAFEITLKGTGENLFKFGFNSNSANRRFNYFLTSDWAANPDKRHNILFYEFVEDAE